MPKISIMTLSNRWGGVDIMWANCLRQTEQDFELVFVDALWREREEEVKAYINDPRLVYIRQSDKREGAHTNLAHADNEGFRACTGELIVLVQDYIWIPPTSLEMFWFHHTNHPEGILVSGVGHQYSSPTKEDMVDQNGKITVFEKPYTKRPESRCWQDPRMRLDQGSFYETEPNNIEFNYCAIPRKVVAMLGGMDEQFDYEGFAWDNVYMAVKAEMLGFKSYMDQANECMGFNHDGWWPNPLKVNRVSPAEYYHRVMQETLNGTRPIKLDYVTYPDLLV